MISERTTLRPHALTHKLGVLLDLLVENCDPFGLAGYVGGHCARNLTSCTKRKQIRLLISGDKKAAFEGG